MGMAILLRRLRSPYRYEFPSLRFLFGVFLVRVSIRNFRGSGFRRVLLRNHRVIVLRRLYQVVPFRYVKWGVCRPTCVRLVRLLFRFLICLTTPPGVDARAVTGPCG